ncbi:MAG: hypothetical protein JNM20_16525 [Rhizobiales bacterium]|nr:hypothetical protein [Hyphomicrobiales bacterium]
MSRVSVRRLQAGDDVGAAGDLLIRFFREEGFDTPDAVIRANTTRLAAVEAFLKERGAAGYQVTVTPFAEEAHGLQNYYRKLGFASEGRLILYKKL